MATSLLDTVAGINSNSDDDKTETTITLKEVEVTTEEPVKTETMPLTEKTLEAFNNVLDDTNIKEIKKKSRETRSEEIPTDSVLDARDPDFYTRSMDLSDKDFVMDSEFSDKKLPVIVKILIFILIIALVAIAVYFIHQRML